MKKTRLFLVAIVVMLPLMAMAGKAKVLKIDFKNPIAERNVGSSSFDIMSLVQGTPGSVTLLSYINAIDAAAEDKNISMIYMTPENISCGTAQLEEIRAALERFKKSGKPIAWPNSWHAAPMPHILPYSSPVPTTSLVQA